MRRTHKRMPQYNITNRRRGKKFLGGAAGGRYNGSVGNGGNGGAGGRVGVLLNICHFLCSIMIAIFCRLRKMKPVALLMVGMMIGYAMLISSNSGTQSHESLIPAPGGNNKGSGGGAGTSVIHSIPPHQDWKHDSSGYATEHAQRKNGDDMNSKIIQVENPKEIENDVENKANIRGSKSQPVTNYQITKKGEENEGGGEVADAGKDSGKKKDDDALKGAKDPNEDGTLGGSGKDIADENPGENEDANENPGENEDTNDGNISENLNGDTQGAGENDATFGDVKQEDLYYADTDHANHVDVHDPPPLPPTSESNTDTSTNSDPGIDTDSNSDTTPSSNENGTSTENIIVHKQALLSSQSVPTKTTPYVIPTKKLPDSQRKKIMVTGGAGFVGSHLVDKLMMEGHEVIVVDNFFTGQKKNIEHWLKHPNFSLKVHDVTNPITVEVDQIYHLACPASPPHYQYNPVKTIKTSTMGTLHMLGLAKRVKARMLLASTSEIYGDPEVHPQPETYWGNVNTIGPRACYDEGKRVAETMMYSYRNQNDVEVRVARIFNTFGPRMHPNDGRVVSNFIIQALQDKDITIYGDGKQTRSFQYVSDLVDGLHALMNGNYDSPVNLGNPAEYSVEKFALYIQKLTKSKSEIKKLDKSEDDPTQRKPDIAVAKQEIDWEPTVEVEDGLKKTIEYFQSVLKDAGEIIPTGPNASKPRGAEEY